MPKIFIESIARSEEFSEGQIVTIGRSADSTFQIDDQSVSRKHGELRFNEKQNVWIYQDAGSANGSYIEGVRINSIQIEGPTTIKLGHEDSSVAISIKLGSGNTAKTNLGSVLADTDVIIGKAADAIFILTDVLVSRKHARLITSDSQFILEDLGSTNGTFLGTERVQEIIVDDTTTFRVGVTEIKIVSETR